MTGKQGILVGCGCAFVLGGALALGLVALFLFSSQDPPGARISVNFPPEVTVGETFDLVVTIFNDREDEPLKVLDIDFFDDYIDGFTIVSVIPEPDRTTEDSGVLEAKTAVFDQWVRPGESEDYIFTLRAERVGVYSGEVRMCEGFRFLSKTAQTEVKE